MTGTTIVPHDDAPPRARAMFDSLRGIGYSAPAAIADLIDNSITAGARRVRVDFIWRGDQSVVRVLDDGRGMTEARLIEAMRPASHDPFVARDANDLGRFGLGLKTASLSQGRLLSVVTRTTGRPAAARYWDLDHVFEIDQWHLLHGIPPELVDIAVLPAEFVTGTAVVIGRLDRLIGPEAADENPLSMQRFHAIARSVERHLGMTFHRYLEGPKPELSITLNGDDASSAVHPWDPFMQSHPATTTTPVERFVHRDSAVEVQGFVLPHRDRLTSDQFEQAEGPTGWLSHEGFFIYRGRRLLVPGGWLGLGQGRAWVQNGIHRLARLRLDLPTSGDHDWKVDIRKSSAIPPPALRNRLQGLADKVRRDAREIFAHRGGRPTRQPERMIRAWSAVHDARGTSYKIDRTHPSVKRVLDTVGDHRGVVEEMLSVIEATVPVQRIWMDHMEAADTPAPAAVDISLEERTRLVSLYRHMRVDLGLAAAAARERLLKLEPFAAHPDAVSQLPDDPA